VALFGVSLALVLAFRAHPPAGSGIAGAGSEFIYASPLVTKAPAPHLSLLGDSALVDARGAYQRHAFGAAAGAGAPSAAAAVPPYVNVLYSKAGTTRSGDIHRCAQLNVLAAGAATLTRLVAGDELVTHHVGGVPPASVVLIPPHVPHLWSFTADTVMTESWLGSPADGGQCAFEAWYYAPFRARVAASLDAARNGTAAAAAAGGGAPAAAAAAAAAAGGGAPAAAAAA